MSSEAPDQPAAEDVSFADILEQPEGSDPPSAGEGKPTKAADVTPAPPENGDVGPDTAGAAAPAAGSGDSSAPEAAPEPMDVSDGPPGAAGDAGGVAAGGSGGVAPPPGLLTAAEAGAKAPGAAADTPASEKPAVTAEKTPAPSTEAAAETPTETTDAKEAQASDPATKETQATAPSSESKTEKDANPSSESKTEKDANPSSESKTEQASESAPKAETPAAEPAAAPSSKPNPASKPAAKVTPAPKPAGKSGPASKKTAPASQPRPIPPDAEPIRVFSSGAAVAGPKPKPKTPEPEPLTELEKLWKPVKQNPADFTAWTLLIQYAEAQCFMEDIRAVLKAFLARYPYCYGYWKKYSDLEKKRGTPELCHQVFEAGLTAVPLSVDLWLHYLHHMRTVHEDRPELVRAAFERAITACGAEFRSDRLWEQYASWETTNKEPVRALAVYKRAIAVPTLSYRTHFENLEQFVGETPPQELLTVGEFLEARRAVLSELKASEPPAAAAPPSSDLLPPGCDEPPPGVPAQPAGLSADEECVKLRAKILAPLRQLHKETEKQVSLRWNFEEGIKRPYFHVKPLEKAQLKNWKSYLDFEIEQGDKHRIRVLFERCMISCALYEEYWMKYIRYLESQSPMDPDRVRSVFRRACWTHLPNKPAIHLMWATFEEKQGDLEAAAEVMEKISSLVTMLEVILRRINLARRAGRLDTAERMYADALKTTQHRETAIIIAVKFVRFLYKVRDSRVKALEVLREAILHDQTSMRLYMQMVDIGFQSRPVDVALVDEAFQMAVAAPFEQKDKLTLAHRRVEFLEEFGTDAESLQTAQDEYYGLLKVTKAEAKKKKQEEEAAAAAAAATATVTAGKRAASSATNGTEKKARVDPAAGTQIPTITETPARPAKNANYRAPAPAAAAAAAAAAAFTQPPPAAYGGFNQPPPQQQQYQYPAAGYQQQQQQQQQGAPGWPGYPPQYNYNQYGQGYQYPYQ